ncbi:MAG: putative lipid II flippase FtsW [Armatimonadota bacterium]
MEVKKQVDLSIFIATIMLVVIGVLLVFDASYARASEDIGKSGYFGTKQAIFAVAGILGMLLIMTNIKYWKLKQVTYLILALSVFGLVLVFLPGIGHSEFGARRWINIAGQRFQPSEFAKLGLIIYLAYILSRTQRNLRDVKNVVLIMIPVCIIGLLIVIEDMGTAIIVFATALAMMFMAGARINHLVVLLLGTGCLGIVFIALESYRLKRMLAFLDPFKYSQGIGYQVCQSLISLGSGGIFGMGICEGRQKLGFLPAEHTDFIFSTLGQEAGLIGTVGLSALFLFFGIKGLAIASRTKEPFGKLLAGGITVMICGQAFLNMAVVTSSLPATGVPLPFISYGGSSLVMNLLCVGILLGISRYPGLVENYESKDRSYRRRNRRPRVSGS